MPEIETATFFKMSQRETENFVTVVSVGIEEQKQNLKPDISNKEPNNSGYVTVLTIGDSEVPTSKDVVEEVLVYRLPGERLGFGLKFEGGTKASEFVKRLFIQSCAPDSPASRVTSSWGNLTEGDEVLEIDSVPVNSMTRIDCVRCLKDSNVVIKLLVRHFIQKTRSVEDLPLVISAEKKRTPPPPPPVPPRKIPRKLFKHNNVNGSKDPGENPAPVETNGIKAKKFQSPRSSGRSSYSPDVSRRDRRFSDGSLGPPDAEVYVDLFSQESTLSLSESDDTGSTISTVIDRFGSFPTTTTSSFAGSLPSTPTAVQKQLDLSNLLNAYEDDELPGKVATTHIIIKSEDEGKIPGNDEGVPLQPPSCFQDAPLSYGNEDMRIADEVDGTSKRSTNNNNISLKFSTSEEIKLSKKPPVPPRSRDINNTTELMKEVKTIHDENMNISNLPRLVDFVPKTSKESIENPIEVMKLFLENERRDVGDFDDSEQHMDVYGNGMDIYSSKWSLSPQLATIGEVEEEGGQEFQFIRSGNKSTTPIVIVENADSDVEKSNIAHKPEDCKDIDGNMEIPPSDSRQPPDGHEFPDYVENSKSSKMDKENYQSNYPPQKIYKSVECINLNQAPTHHSSLEYSSRNELIKTSSMSNNDLRPKLYDTTDDIKLRATLSEEPPTNLHHRSQSLIDMSALSKQKNDKWNNLVEQRKKGLSKLKGLVIPEQISEVDVTSKTVNLPEIKSQNTPVFVPATKLDSCFNHQPIISDNSTKLVSPPWSITATIPKYSPAFKRKSLQIYPTVVQKDETKHCKPEPEDLRLDNLSDPPKSLESITSPTRSDCSFDYVSSSKKHKKQDRNLKESHNHKLLKDLAKSEDESDNDSALSSSQSSYISRCSPPPSPTNDFESINSKTGADDSDKYNSQCRLLKPSSVEAINRKNILASAKCRSGRDLKVGSPVIHRKYEENESTPNSNETPVKTVDVTEKVNSVFSDVETIAQEIATEKAVVKEKLPVINSTPPKQTVTPPQPPTEAIKEKSEKPPVIIQTSGIPKQSQLRKTTHRLPETKTTVREITRSEYRSNRDAKPLSVNALKKNFENFGNEPPLLPQKVPQTVKPPITTRNVKLEVLKTEHKISKEKPAVVPAVTVPKKVEEVKSKRMTETPVAVKQVEKQPPQTTQVTEAKTVVLNLESVGGSLGITLAGGTDYEIKDVTIHRIRYGSVAYQDGRLKKGDKIITVNDTLTKGLTHAEAVDLLKAPLTKFSIVVEENKEQVPSSSTTRRRSSLLSTASEPKSPIVKVPVKTPTNVITLVKDSGGLGFSIEGGKDSPQGDVPLLIKKIFQGGAADKCGQLFVGDELLAINEISFVNLSRIEAWTMMKKIPDGSVNIHIYR